jgi:hypothetical protein
VTRLVCEEIAQNVAQTIFRQYEFMTFTMEKSSPQIWATSVIKKNCPKKTNAY